MSDRPRDSENNREPHDSGPETRDTGADGPADASAPTDADSQTRTGADNTGPTAAANDRNRSIDLDALKWLSGIAALVGLWIAASPFVYESTQMALWNNLAVGAAIFLLAGFNFYRMTNDYRPNVGTASLVALLGLWSVVAPFLIEYASEPLMWSTVVSGAVVAILSAYNAYEGRQTGAARTTGTGT